jgi:AcrR family transcriptional regulator
MPNILKKRQKTRRAGRPAGADHGTRSMIVNVASALLAEAGMEGLSNRLICERCAITPPTLYHHFSDRNALLEALVTKAYIDFFDFKRKASGSADPLERFKESWRNFADFAATNPEHFKLMASASIAGRMPKIGRESYSYPISHLEAIKEKYGLTVSVALAAQLSMSTAFGVCMLRLGWPDIPWDAGLSEAGLEAVLQFILK